VSGASPLASRGAPRHDLDRALADLVERANAVANTQGRLRDLLRATRELIEETDLPLVLRRIVEAAVELVGARYGAMGVVAPDGTLEQFIHVGMPADTAASIGHPPRGAGLLGALIADPTPIRLEHIADDERSAGFPAHHPPMDSFLGVPVRVRDQVFGNLYLTDSGARSFSREDEELVTSLATTAGFAIDNARLLQETRLRARWAAATTELTTQLLDPGTTDPDAAIAVAIAVAADADLVCIVRASADEEPLRIAAAWGATDEPLVGTALAATGTAVADALGTDAPATAPPGAAAPEDPTRLTRHDRSGPVLAVPLSVVKSPASAITIARDPGAPGFGPTDVEAATDLAAQVSVALDLVRARTFEERTMLLEDRGRIARDLHDHVIQDLFGTGLQLQALATMLPDPAQAQRLERAIERLDDAISQIRSIIFATSPFAGRADTARHRIMDLAAELSATLPSPISVRFSGPIDHSVDEDLLPDLIAVARELLTNAVRHARAESIGIRVDVAGGQLTMAVRDDGVGLRTKTRESGLRNITHRAEKRGGAVVIGSRPGATSVQWSVPVHPVRGRSR